MYTRKEQRLLKKYEREDNLLYPVHKTDTVDPLRDKFLEDLIYNEHFVSTGKANDKKYAEPFTKTLKQFNTKDYMLVLLFGGVFSGVFGGVYSDKLFHHDNVDSKKELIAINALDVLAITAMALIGIVIGGATLVAIKDANRELSIDKFYARMSVRLFDALHRFHPELKEEVLENCNPEMARVITTLLIANMSETQTRKLQSIAMDIAEHRYSKTYKAGIEDLKARERLISTAASIIESHLLNNPELKDIILDVYKGRVPKTFVLNIDNQKTK